MILVRYASPAGPAYGLLKDHMIYALDGDIFKGSEIPRMPSDDTLMGPVDEIKLLAPSAPTKIVAVGRNYAEHAAEFGNPVPEAPLLFFKPPTAVIGPGASIVSPPETKRLEHEAELCLVMARRCSRVSPEAAWDYVLGVTCGNDVTARDIQRSDPQWTRGKGFDTSAPIGPWIVTGLSATTVADLSLTCQVNGEYRQMGNTRDMIFSSPELVSYISQMITLEPGDVVMTGTPAGVGPLEPGDLVEVTIERVGTLSNPVTARSGKAREE